MSHKDVIISIQGRQMIPLFGLGDVTELITAGQMYNEEDHYFVTYPESELTGLDGAVTTLMVESGKVTMVRAGGGVTAHMVFEAGRKYLSYYDTDEGALTVGVSARRVHTAFGETGGDIEVDYAVEIDNAMTGSSNLKIHVRPAGSAAM